jgi:molybdopterin/thiamine biosynthesis adenylyltransferase
MITQTEQEKLRKSKVCVLGCGGLGGYIIEFLVRLGIGYVKVVDGDCFDETNLNRQLLATENNIGQSKAFEAKKRAKIINSDVQIEVVNDFFSESNALDILSENDLIIDALDNIIGRKVAQKYAKVLGIPLIHGAIAGWYGQVCVILPGDDSLNFLYNGDLNKGEEETLGNPSFTPALIASIEVSEALKVLLDKGDLLRKEALFIDLLDGEMHKLPLPIV